MKVKTNKQMTLEEYAKYMIDNYGVSGYESELIDENIIGGPMRFAQIIELNPILKKDVPNKVFRNGKMIVEVAETVNETTRLKKLVEVTGEGFVYDHYNSRIVDIVNYQYSEIHAYIDGEFKCIWRDGKLVE